MMPQQYPYPDNNGWAGELNDRRKRKPEPVSDDAIAQHKAELQEIAGQWSNGEVSSQDVAKAIGARGWQAIELPGSPRKVVQGMHQNLRNIAQDLVKSAAFMRELGRGVITFLDPRNGIHRIEVGGEEKQN